jgi:hypothetical protein
MLKYIKIYFSFVELKHGNMLIIYVNLYIFKTCHINISVKCSLSKNLFEFKDFCLFIKIK